MHFPAPFNNAETWVAVAFVIFVVLFGRRLWRALAGMLDQRAATIRAELTEARRLKREAEAMLAEAIASRTQALADAKRLLEGAKIEAVRLGDAARADASASAARRERMAMDRIAAAEKAAVTEVRIAAAEIAATAAERVIRNSFGGEAAASLVDHAIATLPTALSRRAA